MKRSVFALVDCDAFYVSCERLFATSLHQRPVIVVGNHDATIIARSKEAKALGIPMAAPLFRYQALIKQYQVAVFSSNYALYQDLSDRVMACLAGFASRIEQYSIDEAWLDLSEIPDDQLLASGKQVRERVLQETGIPVSVGIAPTKVLSKAACEAARRHTAYHHVLNYSARSTAQQETVLQSLEVEEVWGIGKQWGSHLRKRGIAHAAALRQADQWGIRRHFPVQVERAVLELQGICCLPLQSKPKPRQSVLVSRSFQTATAVWQELEEALATYVVDAAAKLRQHQMVAGQLGVFLATNPFDRSTSHYAQSSEVHLPLATAFPPDLLDLAQALLRLIYRPGYSFKRVGVVLDQLHPERVTQPDLFGMFSGEVQQQQRRLMQAVDEINWSWGPETIFYAAQGVSRTWVSKPTRRSPRYTTRWTELLSP